jgi:CheY-like chemotaxis protein
MPAAESAKPDRADWLNPEPSTLFRRAVMTSHPSADATDVLDALGIPVGPEPEPAEDGPPLPKKHPILVVDDEDEILFSLRGLLRQEFDLHTARSGAEALEIMRRHVIHVIMTDQRMPQMTGIELLRRARGECPEAVRIVFTGYADIKAVIDAINEGQIFRYLTKPWDPDELVLALRQGCAEYDRVTGRRTLLLDFRDYANRCRKLPADEMLQMTGAELLDRIDRELAADEGKGGMGAG